MVEDDAGTTTGWPEPTAARRRATGALAAVLALALAAPLSAEAADTTPADGFTVDSAADVSDSTPGDDRCDTGDAKTPGDCTLRAAIEESSARGADDSILVPPGTYPLSLSKAQLDVVSKGALTISRLGVSGDVVIDGQRDDRVLKNHPSAQTTLNDLILENGDGSTSNDGAGIKNQGTLTLNRVTVRTSSEDDDDGGGIYNDGSAATLTLNDSLVERNDAPRADGGGIANVGGSVTLNSTTVSGNSANVNGGGLANEGGGTVGVNGGAVRGNDAGIFGGGIANGTGERLQASALQVGAESELTLNDTTVDANLAASGGGPPAAAGRR